MDKAPVIEEAPIRRAFKVATVIGATPAARDVALLRGEGEAGPGPARKLIPALTRLGRVDTLVPTHWSWDMSTSATHIRAWGNGLAVRLTKPMAKTAGVAEGSLVRVTVKPGRIVIETEVEPTLEQMLAAFDPKKHGGEVMASGAVGVEVFANGAE